ncbi:MAG: 30S ribosomal protein S6 [Patescibacteria group bacterium]|nr:30S ribosomal protein S6 [Patescibacteria group bacterium]
MYEITFISKEENDASAKKVIESANGKIVSESTLGRRKFAYPIKKELSGCYITYVFECDPEKIEIINKKIALDSNVIRYLLIQKIARKPALKKEVEITKITSEPVKIATPEKKETKTEKETLVTKKASSKTARTKKTVAPKAVKKSKVEKVVKNKEVEITEEERLKALNDKLSELLKE